MWEIVASLRVRRSEEASGEEPPPLDEGDAGEQPDEAGGEEPEPDAEDRDEEPPSGDRPKDEAPEDEPKPEPSLSPMTIDRRQRRRHR